MCIQIYLCIFVCVCVCIVMYVYLYVFTGICSAFNKFPDVLCIGIENCPRLLKTPYINCYSSY